MLKFKTRKSKKALSLYLIDKELIFFKNLKNNYLYRFNFEHILRVCVYNLFLNIKQNLVT
jgi:hypothetical protein